MAMEATDGGGEVGPGKRCSRCGAGFHCGRQSGEPSCWCAAMPNVLSVTAYAVGGDCLGPDCLTRAVEAARAANAARAVNAAPARLVPPPRPQ